MIWQRLNQSVDKDTRFDPLGLYARLDIQHDLSGKQVHRDFFNKNPEHNARWTRIYFANPAIVGGRMQLRFFLENNPAELFKTLLANQRQPSGWLAVAQYEQ